MKGQDSTLTVNEIEKMFGFPEHYTDVMNFNANIRQKLLGKAWSVEVVSALLEPLTQYFRIFIKLVSNKIFNGSSQVTMKGQDSTLTVNEIEKMFGFPEHYTDVMNFKANIRQKLLG
ncbi:hypothetical protein J6590_067462 [Homalodisca vitripennis]|nr:hypothetical protein J6590_067462 [Homalodisca vitripennis]